MTCNRRIQHILTLILILWTAFIWAHSMIPASGSSEESRVVGEIVRPFLEVIIGKGQVTDVLLDTCGSFMGMTLMWAIGIIAK